jgi:NAD(P)-dependent dehydrogenase (short-subunit alcohol dehydrogenase family)
VTSSISLQDLISLRGKRALITGAAAGMGKAIARRFAEAGADLELVDIDAKALPCVSDELSNLQVKVGCHVVDLSQKEQIDGLWAQLKGSAPDILVNNAGIYPFKRFLDLDEAFFHRVMEINLFSVGWMCQHMISQRGKRGGVIINIGSIEGVRAFKDDVAHYSISKAGVIALTRALAKEHAKDGFRVNAILPGGILTDGTKAAARRLLRLELGLVKTAYDFGQRLPAGRLGQPDEVARMALVLASDLASYVHGASIAVDGGFLAV